VSEQDAIRWKLETYVSNYVSRPHFLYSIASCRQSKVLECGNEELTLKMDSLLLNLISIFLIMVSPL